MPGASWDEDDMEVEPPVQDRGFGPRDFALLVARDLEFRIYWSRFGIRI